MSYLFYLLLRAKDNQNKHKKNVGLNEIYKDWPRQIENYFFAFHIKRLIVLYFSLDVKDSEM